MVVLWFLGVHFFKISFLPQTCLAKYSWHHRYFQVQLLQFHLLYFISWVRGFDQSGTKRQKSINGISKFCSCQYLTSEPFSFVHKKMNSILSICIVVRELNCMLRLWGFLLQHWQTDRPTCNYWRETETRCFKKLKSLGESYLMWPLLQSEICFHVVWATPSHCWTLNSSQSCSLLTPTIYF